MKYLDWVETPEGIGRVAVITSDKRNAYVVLGGKTYCFALELVKPLPKEVADILTAVKT